MKKVNYVYIKNDYLRHLEKEFSLGISNELQNSIWESNSSILKCRKDNVNVTFFIYRRAHIMMSHGLADKNYLLRLDPKGGYEINKYKYVCVPGQWMKDKLLMQEGIELTSDQIVVVGWPRIDKLLAAKQNYELTKNKREDSKLTVLWAPTHAGGQKDGIYLSSYPGLLPYEETLRKEFNYIKSLHPSTGKTGKSTFEQLLEADVVISDRGTLVYEAWALGKPVIFPDWLIKEGNLIKSPGSAESEIFRNNIGLHAESFDEMISIIRNKAKVTQDVKSFLSSYLDPTAYGESYKRIAKVVEAVWNSGDLSINPKVSRD